jgi:flagellin-like hook-associated protein FlgL
MPATSGLRTLLLGGARGLVVSVTISSVAVAIAVAPFSNVRASTTDVNWSRQNASQAPSPRAWASMDYDSRRSRTVMFGGYDGNNNLSDTWEWDGSAWSTFSPVPGPPAAVGQGMAFDSARGVSVLLINSVTWEWDDSTWTLHPTASAPSARTWTAMTYDSMRKQVVLFGGQAGGGALLGDTWTYDGINWTKRSVASAPSPRFGMAMTFDSDRGVVVLFGGRTVDQRMNDTWEWDGATWTQRNPVTVPLTRFWHSMAYDAQLGKTVMFGGDKFGPSEALGPINDTWLWDGTNWTRDWTAGAPSPRAGLSMAYDSSIAQIVLFGGTDESTPGVYSNETWELGPGNSSPAGSPAVSFSAATESFGGPTVGTSSSAASIWVTSSGTGPLLISMVSTTGDFAVVGNDCPAAPDPLAPGSYCRVQVTFSPTVCGYRSGNLTFTDNRASGSDVVFLQGVGVAAGCDDDLLVIPPTDATVNATSSLGAVVKYLSPLSVDFDEAANPPAVTCDHASGSTFSIGTTVVTCQATDTDDAAGTAAATFRITVNDTDLALTGVPADIAVSPSSASGAVVNYVPPTAADEDGTSSPVDCSPAPGSTFPIGVTTVSCQTSDPDDTPSTVSATFHVRVGDADLALTAVPSNLHFIAGSSKGATLFYGGPFAVDEESPAPDVSCDHPSGTVVPIGITTVTCHATDNDDTPSTVTATFQVSVTDTDLALTNVPSAITVNAPLGSPGATVMYTPPTVSDEDASSVTCVPGPGSTFPIGTTNVTCWATDADDTPNTATAVFPVTVNDTDFVLVAVPADVTVVATGPSGAVVNYVTPTAVDEDPSPVAVSCAPASGSTFPVGATTVMCQALDNDDLGSALAFFHVTVVPDVGLTIAVSPTTASAHDTVTTTATVTDIGTATTRATVTYTVLYTDSNYNTSTVTSDKAIVNLTVGATATRSFSFAIKNQTPTGYYTVVVTASDSTGTVTQYGNFTVI